MVLLCLFAFLIPLVLARPVAVLARSVGALDLPDGVRKLHTGAVARLGGLVIFASVAVVLPFAAWGGESPALPLLLGGALLSAGGIADDCFSLPPAAKFLLQFAAALPVALLIPGVSALFSFVVLLLFINAANLSDGLDGLCAGYASIAFLFLAIGALSAAKPDTGVGYSALLLLFATLGFLPSNLRKDPARKFFLGDCGSQFLGFSVGVLALYRVARASVHPSAFAFSRAHPLAAVAVFALPLADLAFAFFRRVFHRKNPFLADRDHIHHRLLRRGFSPAAATLFLLAAASLVALLSL